MNNIKTCISVFAEIMNENVMNVTCDTLTAECFRLCKFNKPESDEQMFQLLFNVICICDNISAGIVQNCDRKVYVFNVLQRNGFILKNQHSRQYLLALGWMISKHQLLSLLMKRSSVDELDFSTEKRVYNAKDVNAIGHGAGDIHQLFRKVNVSLRSQLALKLQLAKLKYQISKQSGGIKDNGEGLSIKDLYALRNSEFMNQHIESLKRENKRLEKIVTWRIDCSQIFWQWMATVIEEDVNSEHEIKPDAFTLINEFNKLHSSISDYESECIHLECTLKEKTKNISKSELKSCDREFQNYLIEQENEMSTKYSEAEFIYTDDTSKTKDLKLAIADMQTQVDELNAEIGEKRKYYKKLLIDKIENMIVLDPF